MLLLMGTSPEVNNNCNLCLCQEKFPAKQGTRKINQKKESPHQENQEIDLGTMQTATGNSEDNQKFQDQECCPEHSIHKCHNQLKTLITCGFQLKQGGTIKGKNSLQQTCFLILIAPCAVFTARTNTCLWSSCSFFRPLFDTAFLQRLANLTVTYRPTIHYLFQILFIVIIKKYTQYNTSQQHRTYTECHMLLYKIH